MQLPACIHRFLSCKLRSVFKTNDLLGDLKICNFGDPKKSLLAQALRGMLGTKNRIKREG